MTGFEAMQLRLILFSSFFRVLAMLIVVFFSHCSTILADSDLILAHVRPTDVRPAISIAETSIEMLLAQPLSNATQPKVPLKPDYLQLTWDKKLGELHQRLFPGMETFILMEGNFKKLASLTPAKSFVRRDLIGVLERDNLETVGTLIGDPVDVYNQFIILVDRDKYTLSFYGSKNEENKTLLFQCRTGLGSPEFPTPKGSYYIIRIFDNKPLWIPPQHRDWAYGQAPSHSVYGGHMLPFFQRKAQQDGREEVVNDLDSIAPQFKMVDTETYRIHGTDSPWSIGSGQSHGCVRLLNKSVKQLSDTLKMYVGTTTRGETPNGTYINLAKPVRLVLH